MTKDKTVNTESPVFLYDQVKMEIKEMISRGEIAAGQKLPNEKELCETFNASRITVRRALKELESEGVLEILHGKGTFVKSVKQKIHILNLQGFTDGLAAGENGFTKVVLLNKIETADAELMQIFQREEPFEIVKLVRLIKDGNSIFSVDFAYLPCDIYPGISDKIKDNVSTFNIIHNDYGIKFVRAKKEMEFLNPSQDICKLLEISRMDAVIQIKKLIKDQDDVPVHYSLYYLLANKVNFYIDVDWDENVTF
ncbi:DNA-binding transcriptional regulator FrlR [Neobacillus bataviensis LMG 21833]|uniref:DNA-binding transcriptional regulator FrlR n=1 Tax=Neobacillus bataviensis LMG 21833 TaxID=1117379 RepID=K6E732_9BACI|nr:GntR family transcriptional regulator [Neobacillus bataviensis]EKN69086.1 DNA-binding transcriptional regulator FrlR [Neobacillus bataviensis LMG 21833]